MTTEFNYDHLTPYHRAAVIFCEMNAQDPDEPLRVPHPLGLQGVEFTRPAWHFAAETLLNLSQMLTAMQRAKDEQRAASAQH